ncbi:MAG: NADH:flavin oxidoreductase [Peptococcaceae bacterium]|nr:NADH:flavin oxidoreductase [Peptococcaceae bacterium]
MKLLFSPFQLGGMTLKNRIVLAPTTTCFATPDAGVTDKLIGYYEERARGGAALLIVEPGVVSPRGKLFERSMGIYDDAAVAPLSRLTEAVKKHGAAVFIQLCHAGPKARARFVGGEVLAPSGIPIYNGEPARELSREEIRSVAEDFLKAAGRAVRAGFDGVEIHAAHMYLLSSFLSPLTNFRTDEYGQTTAGRARIVTEIISGIKKEFGESLLVGVRFNGKELDRGIDTPEAVELGRMFEKAGADYVHVSAYTVPVPALENVAAVPATSIAGDDWPMGCFIEHAGAVKQAVSVPVIGVGKLDDPAVAEEALASGGCDLVALGRALIADPEWPDKVRSGVPPVKCLYCGTCLSSLRDGEMVCAVNGGL